MKPLLQARCSLPIPDTMAIVSGHVSTAVHHRSLSKRIRVYRLFPSTYPHSHQLHILDGHRRQKNRMRLLLYVGTTRVANMTGMKLVYRATIAKIARRAPNPLVGNDGSLSDPIVSHCIQLCFIALFVNVIPNFLMDTTKK
jgi:hypothetical protein